MKFIHETWKNKPVTGWFEAYRSEAGAFDPTGYHYVDDSGDLRWNPRRESPVGWMESWESGVAAMAALGWIPAK